MTRWDGAAARAVAAAVADEHGSVLLCFLPRGRLFRGRGGRRSWRLGALLALAESAQLCVLCRFAARRFASFKIVSQIDLAQRYRRRAMR